MLDKKQNVFNDFISAGEWLIKNGYTNSKKLVINGRSNGGLLVAACMVQRPDLFGAVVCEVPVIDMLRYHKFTVGRYWIPEYGNAEANPEHFKFLYAYSPLHNVKKGVIYPPTIITTADHDDRVVPLHAYKFTATLQSANAGDTPILLRVETKAGHGAGKPTSKIIEEQTDIYAFVFKVLGINY
jgi:prolyl oligopeptidase